MRWDLSLTRDWLYEDVVEGKITRSTSDIDAYKMRPEYQLYDEGKFSEYLEKILETVEEKISRAARDDLAVKQFLRVCPPPKTNHRGEPRWEGSKAEAKLKQQMENGDHKVKKPSQLYAESPHYKPFHKKTVRNHIYQAERAAKFTNYVTDKAEAKKQATKQIRDAQKRGKAAATRISDAMTVPQLKEECRTRGIKGYSGKNKGAL